jgi:hypothetical protein
MNQRKKIKRSKLHRMVWEQALSKLAPTLGLSDVGLRKICKRHNIPLPSQGHWAKAPARRQKKPTPLPNPEHDWDLDFVVSPHVTPEGQSELEEAFGARIAAEALPDNRIIVGDISEPPHPMTEVAGKRLEKARADLSGTVTCAIPAAFRIRVGGESVERALRVIDAFVRALEARGLAIEKGDDKSAAGVRIGGQLLRLSLEESLSRKADQADEAHEGQTRRGNSDRVPQDFRPSGNLTLKIDNVWPAGTQTAWRGTPARRLEDRLNEVIAGLYRVAHAIDLSERKEAERQRRIQEENDRRAALRAERASEAKFFEALEADAKDWHRAEILRGFAAAVEARARQPDGSLPDDKMAWIARARRLADRVDPLTPNPPSPLDYNDRDLWPLSGWERWE